MSIQESESTMEVEITEPQNEVSNHEIDPRKQRVNLFYIFTLLTVGRSSFEKLDSQINRP